MDNKTKILLGAGVALSGIAGLLLGRAQKEPVIKNTEWIKSLSDLDWEKERELVRLDFINTNLDRAKRLESKRLLDLFDKVKREKDWNGKTPSGPAYHREHGFNLYKPN